MDRIGTAAIASMVLAAPVWMRLGIAVPDQRMRARAADALAERIVASLTDEPEVDDRQLMLPIA